MEFASFHSNAITALQDFNQLLLDFFNIVDLQFILMLLNDALNLVINGDHPWALGAMTQKKSRDVENYALQKRDCFTHAMHQCATC